jgi:hypothetical protein
VKAPACSDRCPCYREFAGLAENAQQLRPADLVASDLSKVFPRDIYKVTLPLVLFHLLIACSSIITSVLHIILTFCEHLVVHTFMCLMCLTRLPCVVTQLTARAVQRAEGPPQQTVAVPQLPKVRTVQVSAPAETPPLSQGDTDGNSGRERSVVDGDMDRAGDGTWKDKVLGSDQGFRDLTYLMHFFGPSVSQQRKGRVPRKSPDTQGSRGQNDVNDDGFFLAS